MKFNEKWALFLIATFVTFFGIVNTLLKGTVASDVLVNEKNNEVINNNMNNSESGKLTGILSYTVDNCLSSIELSEGFIDFKSTVSEYLLSVDDFSQLNVYPKLLDDSFSYSVEKIVDDETKKIVIRIMDQNDNLKVYTIYVTENGIN